MTETVISTIRAAARKTAALFVAEFGEALDPSETDWDATAWETDSCLLCRDDEIEEEILDDDEDPNAWEIYQAELVAETVRLAERVQMTDAIVVGDHVQAGEILEDYDHGVVLEVDGDRALVAWTESQARTWQHVSVLEPYDPEVEAAMDRARELDEIDDYGCEYGDPDCDCGA